MTTPVRVDQHMSAVQKIRVVQSIDVRNAVAGNENADIGIMKKS
jgi:hypothetical protein